MKICPKRCLVVAPHTDDGEFGCGASLAKLISEGCEVFYLALSTCEESVPSGLPKNILEIELKKATSALGINPVNLTIKNFKVRYFSDSRQEILQTLIDLARTIKPDLVFCPCSDDKHQDHQTVYQESKRAFKCTILGYELPWNTSHFNSNFFVQISESDLNLKIKAIACYGSQSHRNYASESFTRSLAQVRGVQSNQILAEAFEAIKIQVE